MDQRFVESAVIEDHHFVNHCQLKVGLWIIDRQTAVFDQGDLDEQIETNYAEYKHIMITGYEELAEYVRKGNESCEH